MKFRRPTRVQASIELPPLIDVVFLLLVFFVITTTFEYKADIEIILPKVDSRPTATDRKETYVNLKIDRDGVYWINDEMLGDRSKETLRSGLTDVFGISSDSVLTIEADAEVGHQSVVTGLEVASDLGIEKVQILTDTRYVGD